jgi:hypothetical protein
MKKYKTVYVVTCTEGFYSDQLFWVECCFAEKNKAIEFKKFKDFEEEKKRRDGTVCSSDEREYFITKTAMINPSVDLDSIDINNIFDYLGFPGNEDLDLEKEGQ